MTSLQPIVTDYTAAIASELKLCRSQVQAAISLLEEGATIPFIARYRKEKTGNLDEVSLAAVRDSYVKCQELQARRLAILKSLDEQGGGDAALLTKLRDAQTIHELEDLYLPFRPKKRTRAAVAREQGLEPLADKLFLQNPGDPYAVAARFVDAEKGLNSEEDVLAGARDILAERMNEDPAVRQKLRDLFRRSSILSAKVRKDQEEAGQKYRDYFEWSEPAAKAPSHRVHALFRGESEGVLTVHLAPAEEEALSLMERLYVKGRLPSSEQVRLAVVDSYRRLLRKALENELHQKLKAHADEEAIRVFTSNLRELLLTPPLGQKTVLAVDPGFRTGCKTAVLSPQGSLLHDAVIYPHSGRRQAEESAEQIQKVCADFEVEAIAIGNGTAGRETETFLRGLKLANNPDVVLVNESGASIYSASEAARNEFPDRDITVRGAVSIGRRLMDPLAELVKIDPKSIGVGQYQHDVNQQSLKQALDDTVVSCVNRVGVEVNTASQELLSYVSGLNKTVAANIVAFREENGPVAERQQLLKVPRLGPKMFTQSAGFLRIRNGRNPLDASAVHPERYSLVKKMAADLGCSVSDLMQRQDMRERIDLSKYVSDDVGLPTLQDILAELEKPGHDPRKDFEAFEFADVHRIEDLTPGMILPGIVTNVTAFGAFVDVGVHQDGLIHISKLSDKFVRDPHAVVKVQQKVRVQVLEVDVQRRRISLQMKG